MPRKELRRTISLPIDLWKAIDEDAERSKRSAVKQMEAVLSAYYGLADIAEPSKRIGEIFGKPHEAMRQLAPVVARIERGEMSRQDVQRMVDSTETIKVPVRKKVS